MSIDSPLPRSCSRILVALLLVLGSWTSLAAAVHPSCARQAGMDAPITLVAATPAGGSAAKLMPSQPPTQPLPGGPTAGTCSAVAEPTNPALAIVLPVSAAQGIVASTEARPDALTPPLPRPPRT